jgi:hypothetical protein
MPAKTVVKIVFLIIITILAFVTIICGKIVPAKKYKNEAYRTRTIVRIRMGCFLAMLILLLVVVLLK